LNEFLDTRVLVLGGAGFVASAIVRRLIALGARVFIFDNYLHGRPEHHAGLGDKLEAMTGDLRDADRLAQAMIWSAPRFVIDCVGDTFVPTSYAEPRRFFEINLLGTLNALMAAKAHKVERFVYLSSTEIYGIRGRNRLAEDTPLDPVNSYAVSKLAADRLCATFAMEHGLETSIARLFNAYGPRETHPYIVPEVIMQLSRGGDVIELGNADAERDLTYVDDTAWAVVSLLGVPSGQAGVVNIGSDNSCSVRDLVAEIARLMGRPGVRIVEDARRLRIKDIPAFRCDNLLLRRLTGWKPQVSLQDGLARTIDWHRKNGQRWCWEDSQADIHPAVARNAGSANGNGKPRESCQRGTEPALRPATHPAGELAQATEPRTP
jgi:nucleoside-diphosphate-sugar epimerase